MGYVNPLTPLMSQYSHFPHSHIVQHLSPACRILEILRHHQTWRCIGPIQPPPLPLAVGASQYKCQSVVNYMISVAYLGPITMNVQRKFTSFGAEWIFNQLIFRSLFGWDVMILLPSHLSPGPGPRPNRMLNGIVDPGRERRRGTRERKRKKEEGRGHCE